MNDLEKVQENIAERRKAEEAADAAAQLVLDALAELKRPECFWRRFSEVTQRDFVGETHSTPSSSVANDDHQTAQCSEQYIERIEDLMSEVPPAASEFAESVLERAKSIAAFEDSVGYITSGQRLALVNMVEGLKRWVM